MPDPSALVAELAALDGVEVVESPGAWFFFYDPRRDTDPTKRQPFATVVTRDAFDHASDLERRGAFRVNLGIRPETYRARFGPLPRWSRDGAPAQTGHDHAALDTLLPHPVYAPMGWGCVVNPSEETWRSLRPLVAEAHEAARRRYARREAP